EDLHDLAIVAERGEEEPISFEEMKRRLQSPNPLLLCSPGSEMEAAPEGLRGHLLKMSAAGFANGGNVL
ncbi:MAG: hypothetical protein ACE5OR_06530, partial [bacterium]